MLALAVSIEDDEIAEIFVIVVIILKPCLLLYRVCLIQHGAMSKLEKIFLFRLFRILSQ